MEIYYCLASGEFIFMPHRTHIQDAFDIYKKAAVDCPDALDAFRSSLVYYTIWDYLQHPNDGVVFLINKQVYADSNTALDEYNHAVGSHHTFDEVFDDTARGIPPIKLEEVDRGQDRNDTYHECDVANHVPGTADSREEDAVSRRGTAEKAS